MDLHTENLDAAIMKLTTVQEELQQAQYSLDAALPVVRFSYQGDHLQLLASNQPLFEEETGYRFANEGDCLAFWVAPGNVVRKVADATVTLLLGGQPWEWNLDFSLVTVHGLTTGYLMSVVLLDPEDEDLVDVEELERQEAASEAALLRSRRRRVRLRLPEDCDEECEGGSLCTCGAARISNARQR